VAFCLQIGGAVQALKTMHFTLCFFMFAARIFLSPHDQNGRRSRSSIVVGRMPRTTRKTFYRRPARAFCL